MFNHGWYQIAFERDLKSDITPVEVGSRRLMIVQADEGFRVYDATCPHRGAHLAYGGRLEGCTVVCPFHGYRVGLGADSHHGFRVSEYTVFSSGGLLFVRLSEEQDRGFAAWMSELAADHVIVPGFDMNVQAPAELVIENGLDSRHFPVVHGICNDPKFTVTAEPGRALMTCGTFEIPVSAWRPGQRPGAQTMPVAYTAHVFSPGIIVGRLGGEFPYSAITSATPLCQGQAIVRVSLALPIQTHGATPRPELVQSLFRYVRDGLEPDRVIWEHMALNAPAKLTSIDEPIIEFHAYCQGFN